MDAITPSEYLARAFRTGRVRAVFEGGPLDGREWRASHSELRIGVVIAPAVEHSMAAWGPWTPHDRVEFRQHEYMWREVRAGVAVFVHQS